MSTKVDPNSPQAQQILQSMPEPAGRDENGQPYWIIEGQKISWAQVQQMYTLQMQQQRTGAGGNSGIEQMPTMPVMPTAPEAGAEVADRNFESPKPPEQNIESAAEQVGENQQAQQSGSAAAKPAAPRPEPDSYVGESVKLSQVQTNNPASMYQYYKEHENSSDPHHSSAFLATFLGRLLRMLSVADSK